MNISLSRRQRLANIFPAISEICKDNNRLLSNRKSFYSLKSFSNISFAFLSISYSFTFQFSFRIIIYYTRIFQFSFFSAKLNHVFPISRSIFSISGIFLFRKEKKKLVVRFIFHGQIEAKRNVSSLKGG